MINNVKIKTIIDALRTATALKNIPERRNAGIYRNSLQKYYELTTTPPENWEEAEFDEQDFERRLELFKENTKNLYKGRNTVYAYKSRARSAIELYKKIMIIEKQKSKHKYGCEDESIENAVEILDDYTKIIESIIFTSSRDDIYTDKAKKNSNTYIFPVGIDADRIASIMLPKKATEKELKIAKTMLNSIITLEQYRISKMEGEM
ncbi:hypothetical protein IJG71_01895 [Candidatus Saccharibacteria bacterium]|nr:hypothetical protein [Candidatus Saccharibacteria bacterium]